MESEKLAAIAREVGRRQVGDVRAVTPMHASQQTVFRATGTDGKDVVVKLQTSENALVGSCDVLIHQRLRGNSVVRACLAAGVVEGVQFSVFEYVDGRTLLDLIENDALSDANARSVGRQVVDFFRVCRTVKTTGFGRLNADLAGESPSWRGHVAAFVDQLRARLQRVPAARCRELMDDAALTLVRFLDRAPHFERVSPGCVPTDLNLANLLLTPSGRLVVVDLAAFWSADPLLALGEWAGHTFGTALFSEVAGEWGDRSPEECLVTRFYALLSNLSITVYQSLRDPAFDESARPWGNPASFGALMRGHMAALEAGSSGTTTRHGDQADAFEKRHLASGFTSGGGR
jgi:serine/threonine protein kinase